MLAQRTNNISTYIQTDTCILYVSVCYSKTLVTTEEHWRETKDKSIKPTD